jgi:hypothetical protein
MHFTDIKYGPCPNSRAANGSNTGYQSVFGQHGEEVASGLLDRSPVKQVASYELGGDAEENSEEAVGGGQR